MSRLLSPVSCALRRAALHGLQKRSRPILEQTRRDRGPKGVGRFHRLAGLASQQLRPIEGRHHRPQMQPAVQSLGERPDRHLAPATECSHERALRRERGGRRGVVDGRQGRARVPVLRARLDRDDALTGCRDAGSDVDGRRDAVGEPQSSEPGGGEDQQIVPAVVQLAEPGSDVAAHEMKPGGRQHSPQLGDPSDAAAADAWRGAL